MSKKVDTLESNPLWKQASEIAEHSYAVIDLLPSEEDWETKRKLRTAANDLIFYVAQALGVDPNPSAAKYEWANVRKQLFALKGLYQFSFKQGFIEMDPEIMIKIGKLTDEADKQIAETTERVERENAEETQAWIKKYETWREMNK